MAIVKMQHLLLLAPLSDQEHILRELQNAGCVQIEYPDGDENAAAAQQADRISEDMKRVLWALDKLKKFDRSGKVMFNTFPEVPEEEAEKILADKERLMNDVARLEQMERRRGELNGIDLKNKAYADEYAPWKGLNEAPAAILSSSGKTVCRLGCVPARNIEKLEKLFTEIGTSAFEETGQNGESVCIAAYYLKETEKEASKALEAVEFTPETFLPLDGKTVSDFLYGLCEETKRGADERLEMEKETAGIAKDIDALKILYEALSAEEQKNKAAGRFVKTESVFLMSGWVPEARADKVRKRILKLSPDASIEIRDPEENENPPVALENNRFVSAFEPVVEGFSMPDYRSIDPTAVMAPFYACLFGMMVSDAGYGLLMVVLLPIFMKWKKIRFKNAKMLWLLTWGGVATVIWGLVYNTVFGFNPLPRNLWLLDSVSNSLPVMIVCIGVGALHLFTGLGVAAYMNFKRGQPMAAFADQICWFTLFVGLGLFALGGSTRIPGLIILAVSVGVILLFTKRGEKNPLKRITGGLGALYGITSWVSDLLSYMRLFGMGLATGVIGMVFNNLIGMVWAGGIPGKIIGAVLFVACHAFNLAINALGAYVHSCRLQYIEFFGKFYEEGGKPFTPLTRKAKFIGITGEKAEEE